MNRPVPMADAPRAPRLSPLRDSQGALAVLPFAGLVALGYAVAAAMSLNLVSEANGFAALWPAAGIAAGAVTLAWERGRVAVLAAVFLAGLTVNLWSGNGIALSLVFMAANTGEAALFAWAFLRLTGGAAAIARPGDVLRLALAGLCAAAIAAMAGVAGLAMPGQTGILSLEGWRLWMAADLVGILTFAPVFLARWSGEGPRPGAAGAMVDGLTIAGVAAVAWLVLMSPVLAGTVVRDLPLAAMLPVLLWVGIRRSVAAAAWAGLAVAGVATFATIAGRGFFADVARLADPVAAAQVLMAACALTLLTLATVFDERRRAKARLDAAEERQRIAIEGAGAASWDIDLATGKGAWSPAHFAFLGLPPSPDGVGDHAAWRARVHPADLPRVDAAFQASLDGRTPYEAEYRVIRADTGETRWLSGFGRTLLDAGGKPWRSVGIILDVTARVEAETETQRVADSVPAFVYRAAPDGRLLSVNRRWVEYTGQSAADALRDGFSAVVHPEDLAAMETNFAKAAEGRTPFAAEFRCRRHDGAYRWFYAYSEPEIGADGSVAGWFGTSTDIHDRKMAEALRAGRERRDGFLLRLQDGMRALESPGEVAALAAAMLGEETRAGRVLYGELDEAANLGRVDRNWLDGMPDATGAYPLEDFGAALGTLRAGRQMVIDDVTSDPRTAAHCARPDLAALGIGATLDTPLLRGGHLVGLLAIQMPTPRAWTAEEASLAAEVAERTWTVMERLRVQAELRLKTEELESLVNAAPLGVAFFDRAHRYLRINDELAETNGAPAASHLGRTLEIMRPGIAGPLGALIDGVFESGRALRDVEIAGETPQASGVGRHWLANFYPVFAGDGTITQVGVWVIDITARKAAEMALRDGEARLRAVIDAAPVGLVFAEGPSGRITGGNALVEQILGHPVLPSAGVDAYRDWVGFHPDGRRVEGREYPLARALAGEDRSELVTLYRRGDGREAWVRFVAAPIRDASGAVTGSVVASLDIDRERRIEAELRALNADLERRVASAVAARELALGQLHEAQKMEAVGQLTGGVAHDFNNLLAAILSNLDLLRKRVTDRQAAQLIEGAVRGAERGAALTRRLLAFARRQDLKPGRIDLGGLVAGMADLLDRSLGPGVRIEVDLPAGLPAVLADAGQLELAVLNLAVNARDAMPGGGTLTIAAQAVAVGPTAAVESGADEGGADDGAAAGLSPGSYVRLVVRDTGRGMEAGVLARAAEPFFTTKGPGRGTGLGLSMVQGLAAQSGGAMRIDSAPDRGTAVALWLPQAGEPSGVLSGAEDACPVPADGVAAPTRPPADKDTGTDTGTDMSRDTDRDDTAQCALDGAPAQPAGARRILVVDDDILVAMGTVAMLEDLGHSVLEAHDGPAALALLAADPGIDLVVTDHAMPGMTGTELARRIRADRPGLPIVLATGYAELPQGEDLGLPRLAKPFRQQELQAAVDQALR